MGGVNSNTSTGTYNIWQYSDVFSCDHLKHETFCHVMRIFKTKVGHYPLICEVNFPFMSIIANNCGTIGMFQKDNRSQLEHKQIAERPRQEARGVARV